MYSPLTCDELTGCYDVSEWRTSVALVDSQLANVAVVDIEEPIRTDDCLRLSASIV